MMKGEQHLAKIFSSVEFDTEPRPGHREELWERMLLRRAWTRSKVFPGLRPDEETLAWCIAGIKIDIEPRGEHRRELLRRMLIRLKQTRVFAVPWAAARKKPRRILTTIRTSIAAAVVLLLVGVGVWMLSSGAILTSTAFAAVLEQVRRVRGVTYMMILQSEGHEPGMTEVAVSKTGDMRLVMSNGKMQIVNHSQGRRITLQSQRKTYTIEAFVPLGEGGGHDALQKLRELHDDAGERVGEEQLDGRTVNVFRVEERLQTTTIWADAETNLPVRIEYVRHRQAPDDSDEDAVACITTISNFVWDADLDESLFTTIPPKDYVSQEQYDPAPTEEHLVEALRFCADYSDGVFPRTLDKATLGRLLHAQLEKSQATQTVWLSDEASIVTSTTNAEQKRFHYVGKQSLQFIRQRSGDGGWHYRGGVTLGDTDEIVCWWAIPGTDRCRVLYGDLHLADMDRSDLPPTKAPQE